MIRYEDIAEKVARYHPDASVEMIQRGYVVSAKYHKGQLRMNGEPYLTHPLEVANILAEMKHDAVTVTAGLLHDVLEDTLIPPEELRKQFGEDVYRLVDGVTKIAQVRLLSRQQKQAETFRKMLEAMVRDIRVLFVKLADRLHNMRTLQHLSPERRERIALETLDMYAPLAHRLGMAKVRGELEDLAFSFLDPAAYQNTVAQIEARRTVSHDFIDEAENTIRDALVRQNIPARFESRIKRIYSVHAKMKKQKLSIDEVYDFIAIRVITDTQENCYSVLGIIHQLWKQVPDRIRDYIGNPRSNLYQSLHTSVFGRNGQPFEIQIRTTEMHTVAEEGIAAHWKYKEGKLGKSGEEEHFRWLRQLVEAQQDVRDPREFMNNLKTDLYLPHDEIYCFTPRGEVLMLPPGATPVDFAYAIHSEIGNHCVAAKVNGRPVPLRYKLHAGESVEVVTSEHASPSREWLSFVKTTRTRNKIRHIINQKERDSAAIIGRQLMEKEAQRFSTSLEKVLQMPELAQSIAKCGLKNPDEIYPAVGAGTLTPRQILSPIFPNHDSSAAAPSKTSILTSVFRSVFGTETAKADKTAISIKGRDGSLIYCAKCCNPIPGDDIVGYITPGKGIYIHMASCPGLKNLLGTDRITEVEWLPESEDETFAVRLSIYSENRQQVMADVITTITNANTAIVESKFRSVNESGKRIIDIVLNVANVKNLQEIIQKLRSIDDVNGVEREYRLSQRL
jgi:GTP pyrophosphokinase